MKEINEILFKKGFIICNMVLDKTKYELCSRENGEVVIDNLSEAQLFQLAEIL